MEPYRKSKLPGRNEKCPCGSGKKAKNCCLRRIKTLAALPPQVREQVIVANILGKWPEAELAAPPTGPATVNIADDAVVDATLVVIQDPVPDSELTA